MLLSVVPCPQAVEKAWMEEAPLLVEDVKGQQKRRARERPIREKERQRKEEEDAKAAMLRQSL